MLNKYINKIYFLIFFIVIVSDVKSQSCTGSFGTPIVNITFGQGSNPGAQLATAVPSATTSYGYVAPTGNPPANIVLDGDYALVNETPGNPGWLRSGDHTNNGNGYMAFFNAAPNPGEFYKQTITGLCPGTTYEFAAWLLNAINPNMVFNAVPPNITFQIFNPANLTTPLINFSTGDIPATNSALWRRYSTLFITPASITSVVLVLSNNNIGGTTFQGNDLAIDDITFTACGPLAKASFAPASQLNTLTVCKNSPFTLFGNISSGLTNPFYQWQISSDNGINWTNIPGATTLNYNFTGLTNGTYIFRLVSQESSNVSSPFCKFFSNQINLLVRNIDLDAGTDISFCSDNSVSAVLQGTTNGNSISWSPATLVNNSSSPNPIATVNTTTTFYLTSSDAFGCTAIDSVKVIVNALPILNTIANPIICRGDRLVLTASGNATSYLWNPVSSISNPSIANPDFIGINSQTVTVIATGNNGCTRNQSIYVTVNPLPVVRSINDFNSCSSNTATVLLTTTGAVSYSWLPATFLNSTSVASPVFTGSGSNTYYVSGTDANGCIGKDTVSIRILSKPVFNSPGNFQKCAIDRITLTGSNGSGYQYSWSPSSYLNDTSSVNPVSQTPVTTIYALTIRDEICNYDSTFQILVNVLPSPVINISKSNDLDCSKRKTDLVATGALQYMWSPSVGLSSTNIHNPIASPQSTTSYIVSGISSNGCTGKDTITVIVSTLGFSKIYIPNSFTPNGDTRNDCFKILDLNYVNEYTLVILNRWGEKVFETHNSKDCWNGTYKGIKCETGNYIFYVNAKTSCGDFIKKGNVLLIR